MRCYESSLVVDLSRVCGGVHLEVVRGFERFPTDVAHMIPLPVYHQNVPENKHEIRFVLLLMEYGDIS